MATTTDFSISDFTNSNAFLASVINGNDLDFTSGLILSKNFGIHCAQWENSPSTRFNDWPSWGGGNSFNGFKRSESGDISPCSITKPRVFNLVVEKIHLSSL